jgi:hypothetical protein
MTDSAKALTHQPFDSEPALLADSDYDSILSAVMETGRGRWFLHEYVSRNRNADTGTLLAAIDRIESLLKAQENDGAEAVAGETVAETAPPGVSGIVVQLHQIAENLIECGAPMYLCNDLLRRIEELALAFSRPADRAVSAKAGPVAVAEIAVAEVEIAQVSQVSEVAQVAQVAEVAEVAEVEIVVGETLRDPFADILALTPEERIALFT